MPLNAYDASAGVFVRGLSNLKAQLTKAADHVADSGGGEVALLDARLVVEEVHGLDRDSPNDLHRYTLAAQVHWAAEGARLAIAQLLGVPAVPVTTHARSFARVHEHLDATITHLREIAPSDLEASLDRVIVMDVRRGSVSTSGSQFLLAFALPHFFYHVTSAYGILRNHGVPLTMGDYLGKWGER